MKPANNAPKNAAAGLTPVPREKIKTLFSGVVADTIYGSEVTKNIEIPEPVRMRRIIIAILAFSGERNCVAGIRITLRHKQINAVAVVFLLPQERPNMPARIPVNAKEIGAQLLAIPMKRVSKFIRNR